MTTDSTEPDARSRRFVEWTLRNGRRLWAIALFLALFAGWRTVHLYRNLRSDVEELLPRNAPSVVAIQELRQRMPGLQFLGVLVDAGADASPARMDAARRFLADLATRVRAYPPTLVGGVRLDIKAERAFVETNAALLIDTADLQTIRERIEERLHYEYAQETGTLLDDSEPAPTVDFSDIEKKYEARAANSNLENDRFSNARLGTSLLLIEAGGFSTSAGQAAELIEHVQRDVRSLGGVTAYDPGLRLGYTGDVAVSAEETSALMEDLTVSSLLVIGAVVLVLLLYFRWWPATWALIAPLTLATLFAFALANVFGVRELNSNTAFLGSIIVGNGINFGIIQLGRYVEERRRGRSVADALTLALWGTRTGTLSAALAAGVAYAALMAMQFRGFRQFGVIGGLGMALCWLATCVLGPPLIAWLDRSEPFPAPIWGRLRLGENWMPALSTWVSRYPRWIVGVAVLISVVSIVRVRNFGDAQLEHDFSRLRRADT